MRTQDEIVTRINQSSGFLDFAKEVLLPYLDFDHARPFLKDDATREAWQKFMAPASNDAIMAEITEYAEFAWAKVEDHRGLSAGRSINKLAAWIWLLGDDAILKAIETAGYAQYGAPKLAVICKAYGLPIPAGEEIARMIAGEPCVPGCEEGCGQ